MRRTHPTLHHPPVSAIFGECCKVNTIARKGASYLLMTLSRISPTAHLIDLRHGLTLKHCCWGRDGLTSGVQEASLNLRTNQHMVGTMALHVRDTWLCSSSEHATPVDSPLDQPLSRRRHHRGCNTRMWTRLLWMTKEEYAYRLGTRETCDGGGGGYEGKGGPNHKKFSHLNHILPTRACWLSGVKGLVGCRSHAALVILTIGRLP